MSITSKNVAVSPYFDPRSGSATNRYFSSSLIFPLSRSGDNHAPERVQRYRPPYLICSPQVRSSRPIFVVDFFFTYLTLGSNDTDLRPGVSACPDFAVHRPSTLDPRLQLGFRLWWHVLLSLTPIGPACPTTWRKPNRREIVYLGVLVRYLGSITAASVRLFSLKLLNRGDIVLPGVFGACPPSLCHHRLRSPPFTQAAEPWRYRTLGVYLPYAPLSTPPPILPASVRSGCRILVAL